jgi:hypothetical protein
MTGQEFGLSLLSNFLATLVAGTIIGSYVAWKISNNLANKERAVKELENAWEHELKRQDYFIMIDSEMAGIDKEVLVILEKLDKKIPVTYIHLNTSSWNILQTSGEIPDIFEPFYVRVLSYYYFVANEVNEINNKLTSVTDNEKSAIYAPLWREQKQQLKQLKNIIEKYEVFICFKKTLKIIDTNILDLAQEIAVSKGELKKISWYKWFYYWVKLNVFKSKINKPGESPLIKEG